MRHAIFILMLSTGLGFAAAAQDKATTRLSQYNLSGQGLAIGGYDPVSYFSGSPKKGSAAYAVSHQGVVYRFATAENKAAFLKAPAQYEPQYGGWCAYAMGSYGSKVEVDPGTYKITKGKLYLFYNRLFNNTLKSWNKNEAVLLKAADASWVKFYR